MNINNSLRKTPVAVIGLSALFADARNIEEFWTNIIQAKDSITDVPENRWRIEDYYDPDPTVPDKTYCKRGGFIPDIDFNPMEFGLPPNILEVTDASQLLALVAARDALQDAGYGKNSEKFTTELKARTGVLLGVGGGQKLITPLTGRLQYPVWEKALRASGIAEEDIPPIIDKMKKAYIGWNENSFPGMLGNVISGRITNRFDLGGINSVVDAACAASLSAIKMALSELVEGRCDMMLTGGVDTDNSPFMYMSFSKTPAFSKSGNIRPFDAKADGMLIGEGVGMLVLKRLEDAERDGDKIYAVIKGVGTSSDGRFKSVYAPRSSGQALAMNRAYEEAGYAPKTVGLLEAHGTGTGAGDPTEFQSMKTVFAQDNEQKNHIALGSVKSQIGHTKAAAGAAGMIKTVLALHHKVLPPTINVTEPNPKFDIEDSPIYINTEARPWLSGEAPRRAGVSAFGFGGINVHLALEEYQPESKGQYRIHQPYSTILLQADTHTDLLAFAKRQLEALQGDSADATFETLRNYNNTITSNQARLGFVASGIEEAIDLLKTSIQTLESQQGNWAHPKGIYFRTNGLPADTKVVALFAGQGSQYPSMGASLTNAFPQVRSAFAKMDEHFSKDENTLLSKIVFPNPAFNKETQHAQKQALTNTKNAQPAIGTLSMGMYKTLVDAGFKADFVAGHSFGELTALWAADVYDDDTFLRLAKARGQAMSTPSNNADTGAMLAVKSDLTKVEIAVKNLPEVKIANVNSTSQVVLGGSTVAIQQAEQQLKQQGFSVVALPVSAAFHTEFVGHAQEPFAAFIEEQKFNRPNIPVYANSTGKPYPVTPPAIKKQLQKQILNSVLFKDQIENIYDAGGRVFVEFGPKAILTNLVKDILKDKEHTAIALNPNARKDSDLQFRQAVVQMKVLGLPLDNIDPFKQPSTQSPAKTKLSISLGGHNYVSPQTQKAYYDALTDDFQIKGGKTKVIEKEVIKEVEKIVEVPVAATNQNIISNQENESEIMNKEIIQILQSTLDHFKSQQTKSLEVFERFLNDQSQQSQQLLNLLAQQINQDSSPLTKPNGNGNYKPSVPNGIKKVSAPITPQTNGAHADTAVVTQPVVEVKTAPLTPQPTAPSKSGLSKEKVAEILLSVIAEKTGYPSEMLELNMDMEADLGIDSIKRVEIFGAMTEQHPEISGINPNDLTELRTLGQIVDYITGNAASSESSNIKPVVQSTENINQEQTTPISTSAPQAQTAALQIQD